MADVQCWAAVVRRHCVDSWEEQLEAMDAQGRVLQNLQLEASGTLSLLARPQRPNPREGCKGRQKQVVSRQVTLNE